MELLVIKAILMLLVNINKLLLVEDLNLEGKGSLI